jgi:hypothetical protein
VEAAVDVVKDLLPRERLEVRVEPMEVEKDLSVAKPLADEPGNLQGQLCLADPALPTEPGDGRSTVEIPDEFP